MVPHSRCPMLRLPGLFVLAWLSCAPALLFAQDAPVQPSAPPDAPAGTPELVTVPPAEEVPFERASEAGGALPAAEGEQLSGMEPESPRVTLIFNDQPIERIIDKIRRDTGIEVRLHGTVSGTRLSPKENQQPLQQVIDSIAKANNWAWVRQPDGSYDLYDQETYIIQVIGRSVVRKVFRLRYIDAAELDKVIKTVLTPEVGSSSPDERANTLIVTDLPDKLAMIESIIREYDVQLYTHVFEIVNADPTEVADRLEEIKSKYSEIHLDPLNRQIIVKDETLEKIKIMEQLVELLDRDQEIRKYNLALIGEDGKDAEDLITAFIEPLVTENAILEFNAATSVLYVKDVRPVHKKILEVLQQLDRPRKQVMIEGELLSVSLTQTLSLGSNWTFGNSLIDAINTNKVSFPDVPPSTAGQLDGWPIGRVNASEGLVITHMNRHMRVQLSALLSDSRTRLLLKPRLILANHEEGSLEVIRSEPILNTFINDNIGNVGGSRTSTQSFVDSGLIINLVPKISNRGLVEMDIEFENSVPIIVPDIGNGTRGVGKSQQTARTYMVVPSGETRVIAGLISRDLNNGSSGVPWLSQIPYLGFLFGSKSKDDNMRNLMFFVTPTIVEEYPLNDLIVEPVNTPARISMLEEEEGASPEGVVNEIPEELRPYLEQIRPETQMLDDDMTTSLPAPAGDEDPRAAAQQLLTTRPYQPPSRGGRTGVETGGATMIQTHVGGPSGAFGGATRPEPRPRPGRTTATLEQPVPVQPPVEINTAEIDARQPGVEPAATPAPEVVAPAPPPGETRF